MGKNHEDTASKTSGREAGQANARPETGAAAATAPRPQLGIVPARAGLPVDGGEVELLVEVAVDLPAIEVDRRPLTLALVIDRSGSMSGEPLEAAKQAARTAVEMLMPGDSVAVVTFETHVEVPVPLRSIPTDRGSTVGAITAAIAGIHPGGSTDLFGGWAEGLSQVLAVSAETAAGGEGVTRATATTDSICRIVVLSDGQANQGVTDVASIAADVQQATLHGVTTTTMGLGRSYDEALLRAVADAGQGNYVFLEDQRSIVDAFEHELAGLSALRGRQVRLQAEAGGSSSSGPRAAMLRHYRPRHAPEVRATTTALGHDHDGIVLGDLVAGLPAEYLVTLDVEPGVSDVSLVLAWDDVLLGKLERERHALTLPSLDPAALAALAEDERVATARLKAELAALKSQLADATRRGERGEAQRLLSTMTSLVAQLADPRVRAEESDQLERLRHTVDRSDYAMTARFSEKYARDHGRGVSDAKRQHMAFREAELRERKLSAASFATRPAGGPAPREGSLLFDQRLKRSDGGAASWQVVLGDLTKQQVDAIVNSTNRGMFGVSGVDGAISRAGGQELRAAMRSLGSVDHGRAVFTPGYRLPARFVVHTATPAWGTTGRELEYLAMCYRSAFALAEQLGARSVALPAIGTGNYGYPVRQATEVAVTTAGEYLSGGGSIELVRFVCFEPSTADAYLTLLNGLAHSAGTRSATA